MCGPLTTWAENTSAFLNSLCIDLDISICIKNCIHQEGYPVPGTIERTARNNFQLARNIISPKVLYGKGQFGFTTPYRERATQSGRDLSKLTLWASIKAETKTQVTG